MTFYQVNETDGFVEICAVVFEPDIVCPVEFDFNVSLQTCDDSASEDSEVLILLMSLYKYSYFSRAYELTTYIFLYPTL